MVVKTLQQINYLAFCRKFWFTQIRKLVANIKCDFHFFQLLMVWPHLMLFFTDVELSKVMKQRQYNNSI